MPLLNSLATPYADALLQVGDGLGQADQLALEAKSLLEAWYSSADLQGAMRSPVLSLDGKKNALVALFGSEISPSMLNLLKVLVDRQRIGILDAVLGRFLELYRELRGITLATVTSATALSTEQQQKLTEKVKALAGTNSVEVDINVDATLIGGFVVRLGSQVIDASLLGQVKRLGLSLARAA
ncbi:MAG: synthase delta chain [Cyanobacteriota bacterium]|jgi:F-type H+-transporting ATPase subunit delta|nr:F0F1 ATP synthase subunit delta [Synechococcus sp. SupBloom_Metag_053]